ncbi:MAG: hypothetical protein ACKVVP_03790 [Chloroflexota bacterium]
MTALLLWNVGNRDIAREQLPDRYAQLSVRELGLRIAADGIDPSCIQTPILDAALRTMDEESPAPISIVLFCTDQPAIAGVHREKDTVTISALLQSLLMARLGDACEFVRSEVLTNCDPSSYDVMHDAFERALNGMVVEPETPVYLGLSSGTPAANFALLVSAVKAFGDRVRPIYVKDGDDRGTLIDIAERLRRDELKRLARSALNRFEFEQCRDLFERLGSGAPTLDLAEYARRRAQLNFSDAREALQRAQPMLSDADIGWTRSETERLDDLESGDSRARLAELVSSIEMCYINDRYADLLGRIFRYQEAAFCLLCEQTLTLSESEHWPDGQFTEEFRSRLKNDETLCKKLSESNIDPNRGVSRWVLEQLASIGINAVSDSSTQQRQKSLLRRLRRLDKLAALRNKSVIAHGYSGTSAEAIQIHDDNRPLEKLMRDIKDIAIKIGAPEPGWMSTVRDRLLERLDDSWDR